MRKKAQIILVCIFIIVSFIITSSWVSGLPEMQARKLYENRDFQESATRLYLWLNGKGKDAVIAGEQAITYVSEDEETEPPLPVCEDVKSIFQSGIWNICYFDEVMELKLDETFSGRNYLLRLSKEGKWAESLPNESCHLLGQYTARDGSAIDVTLYEGYGGHWELLHRRLVDKES